MDDTKLDPAQEACYVLSLGSSFKRKRTLNDRGHHHLSLRYTFKPESLNYSVPSYCSSINNQELEVVIPSIAANAEPAVFRGKPEMPKDTDCILVFDHSTGQAKLERLDCIVRMNKESVRKGNLPLPTPALSPTLKQSSADTKTEKPILPQASRPARPRRASVTAAAAAAAAKRAISSTDKISRSTHLQTQTQTKKLSSKKAPARESPISDASEPDSDDDINIFASTIERNLEASKQGNSKTIASETAAKSANKIKSIGSMSNKNPSSQQGAKLASQKGEASDEEI